MIPQREAAHQEGGPLITDRFHGRHTAVYRQRPTGMQTYSPGWAASTSEIAGTRTCLLDIPGSNT